MITWKKGYLCHWFKILEFTHSWYPKLVFFANFPFQARNTPLQNCVPSLGFFPSPLTVYLHFYSWYSYILCPIDWHLVRHPVMPTWWWTEPSIRRILSTMRHLMWNQSDPRSTDPATDITTKLHVFVEEMQPPLHYIDYICFINIEVGIYNPWSWPWPWTRTGCYNAYISIM